MIRQRALILAVSVGALVAVPFTLTAQPEKKPAVEDRRSPLPNYFGKIAVSDEQREQLYGVQDAYGDKIEALQKQVKALIAERDQKMEELLTPGQKLRLQELRDEAKQKGAKPAGAAADAPKKSES